MKLILVSGATSQWPSARAGAVRYSRFDSYFFYNKHPAVYKSHQNCLILFVRFPFLWKQICFLHQIVLEILVHYSSNKKQNPGTFTTHIPVLINVFHHFLLQPSFRRRDAVQVQRQILDTRFYFFIFNILIYKRNSHFSFFEARALKRLILLEREYLIIFIFCENTCFFHMLWKFLKEIKSPTINC